MSQVRRAEPDEFDWGATTGAAEALRGVLDAATAEDGAPPLDEAALLRLRHQGLQDSALWLAGLDDPAGSDDAGRADGFAWLREQDLDLVVSPGARQKGLGRALAAAALEEAGDRELTAWSHGNHPGAMVLARDLGFDRVRDLWVMRRSLTDLPPPEGPGDAQVVVRAFRPGEDDEAFLAVNAEAFADHPEQGRMTLADLMQRMAEPWFDPGGFFVATRPDGDLLGYHWTKVHDGDEPVGEVYVVGVSPRAQGLGLGRLLTLTGLHHLAARGLGQVLLYVEADNRAAVTMYTGLGFTHADADTHVQYRRTGS